MNILVVDVGTSSMRGVLYDNGGKPLVIRRVRYKSRARGNGTVEQPASDWTKALVSLCRQAAAGEHPVDALALTSQRSSLIPVDREGRPLRDAVMWQDTRSASVVEALQNEAEFIFRRTGARLNTVFSGTKMAWYRQQEPENYRKTRKLCTIADYLTWFMTGSFVTDASYGSRSLLMDLRTHTWDPELLALFGVEEEKLCRLIEPGGISGKLSEAFAGMTGLKAGIPLVSAGGDQQCGAVGQGLLKKGSQTATFGTGAFLLQYADAVPENLGSDVICGVHAIPGAYVLEASMLTCSALYEWARRILYPGEGMGKMNQETAAAPVGANGVMVLPYFQGRGTPDWNSGARGAFLGLSLSSTRGDMARAVLEAIAMEARSSMEVLAGYGGETDRVLIGGGFTKQPVFPQLLADVSGKTVLRETGLAEETARGAWIVAAVALGIAGDYDAAYAAAEKNPFLSYAPVPEHTAQYRVLRESMNRRYAADKL